MGNRIPSIDDRRGGSEPQQIGDILAELFVQYEGRFPAAKIAVVPTPSHGGPVMLVLSGRIGDDVSRSIVSRRHTKLMAAVETEPLPLAEFLLGAVFAVLAIVVKLEITAHVYSPAETAEDEPKPANYEPAQPT